MWPVQLNVFPFYSGYCNPESYRNRRLFILIEIKVNNNIMSLCDYFTLLVQHLVVYAKAGILHEFHLCSYYYIAGIVEWLYEIAGGR